VLLSLAACEALLEGQRRLQPLGSLELDDLNTLKEIMRGEHMPALTCLPEAMPRACALLISLSQTMVRPRACRLLASCALQRSAAALEHG
jgi:hypothetical protein